MQQITIALKITKEEILKYYSGQARIVSAVDLTGKTVNFPASILRKFVTEHGISGTFVIKYDDSGKFKEIKKL